ncbi:MAG: deoxynucleoside kinase [Gammaproteobacteria bacterium]|jgi:deoxyguanosine kinase|nr:deoxynucleoside kinase [Gammaproteobacteria bacterium]MBT7603146.1 deoxynucleoside kinase [Gammaproteobacteria bacterium]
MKDLISKYIVIEGPIGVGKTSLSNKLALEWDAELILENVDDNPFLSKFYKNPREVSLQTQLYFLLTRTRQVQGFKQQDIFSKTRVSDFMLQKDRLFAQVTLNTEEYDLYDQLYSYMTVDIPKPDLLIYLQAPANILMKRIKKRGRNFEKYINTEYLEKLNSMYLKFFNSYNSSPLLIVNAEDIDFVNNKIDYKNLLNKIYSIKKGRHYFNPLASIINE